MTDSLKCTIPKDICSNRDENGICRLGIVCKEVVEECEGCNRSINGYCKSYFNPKAKWRIGVCPLASHVKLENKQSTEKVRVGQQKQKKRK